MAASVGAMVGLLAAGVGRGVGSAASEGAMVGLLAAEVGRGVGSAAVVPVGATQIVSDASVKVVLRKEHNEGMQEVCE